MKKIYNHICTRGLLVMAGLLVAFCGWGQDVTGDQYESVGSSSFSPTYEYCSSEVEGYYGYGAHYGRYAVDNDRSSYWESDEGRNNDLATITLQTNRSFNGITILSAYNSDNRPVSVKVETSNDGNGNWTTVLDQILNQNDREILIDLSSPINAVYVRLSFGRYVEEGRFGWTYHEIQIYDITFQGESDIPSIQHKPAKWHAQRTGGNYVDDFSDDKQMFTEEDFSADYNLNWGSVTEIQAAHTLIETIYVEKGTSISLALPDRRDGYDMEDAETNVGAYQRWYNFRTDGTFATGNSTGVVDLLTPIPEGSTYYRFANGYVNRPLVNWSVKIPSVMRFYYPENGEDFYLVACDVSGYTDFSSDGSVPSSSGTDAISAFFRQNGYYEPTLTHRVIYQLIGVDSEPSLPIETYDINFPATILPDVTHEMVALSMDARSYVGGSDDKKLTVSIENNNAGIILFEQEQGENIISSNAKNYAFQGCGFSIIEATSVTLSGGDRAIFFGFKSKNEDDGTYSVSDGSTASIVVKKENGTEVARFNLTFRENSRLLSQDMVSQLDNGSANGNWADNISANRTPKNMGNQHILLTELNFDYEDDYGQGSGNRFYPFPLKWESNTYGFYDGSSGPTNYPSNNPAEDLALNGTTSFVGGGRKWYYYPEYSSYSILNDYVEVGGWAWSGSTSSKPGTLVNSEGEPSTYHLYADASDRPGTIARLRFDENLCPGSVLYVSAWVKGARWVDNNTTEIRDNSAMLFTIMGVHEEENGPATYTPIYRHQTGQIPAIYSGGNKQGLKNLPGINSGSNQWYQTYFSFVNTSDEELDYDYYVLQVDNNSASTVGGDMYLDDVRLYIARPMAEVQQLETVCTGDRTLMNLKIDWDRFVARAGAIAETGDIAICFVDTLTFHNAYYIEKKSLKDAIIASAVELGTGGNSYKYRVLTYNTSFESNEQYDPEKANATAGGNLAAANGDAFYGYDEDGARSLAVDFYGDLVAGRTYWIVLQTFFNDGDISTITTEEGAEIRVIAEDKVGGVFADMLDICAIKADFKVAGNTTVKIDGRVVTPETVFCQGNIRNFSLDLRIPNLSTSETNDSITITDADGIYFDWFFGEQRGNLIADPQSQYTEERAESEYEGCSLESALRAFRNAYPNAMELSEATPVTAEFTQGMYNLINYYLNEAEAPEGARNRPLVLHQPSLDIQLLEAMRVVVCPIPMSVPTDVFEEWGYGEEAWMNLCWSYTYLELTTTQEAPTVHAGFNTSSYPDGYEAALRIGLGQIEEMVTEQKALTIDLRDAQSYKENNSDFTLRPVHVGSVVDDTYNKIFLTATNDPDMLYYTSMEGRDERALPIGDLVSFNVTHYGAGTTNRSDNKMSIRFNTSEQTVLINGEQRTFQFIPREGYYYTFLVFFEEEASWGEQEVCLGRLSLTMKVVPEYLVWEDSQKVGTVIGNWNNDGNWKRADKGRLLKGSSDSYLTNEANETDNGFVPMLFSKVIMPRDSKIHLYAAGFSSDKWLNDMRPETVANPTSNIQYDLMVFKHTDQTIGTSGGMKVGDYATERYRVALCDEIHFEPGAEMLHAEYLLYTKAWVDYELGKGNWYTLASPLQGVVAGDFYADSDNGVEKQEYFTDITFSANNYNNGNIANNRFKPSVYQRAWKGNAILQTLNNGTPDVAISGNWSSLYNDVDEVYVPGTGFSLKVQDIADNTSALFRLPKADSKYYYFSYNSDGTPTQGGDYAEVTGTKTKLGRLISDNLYTRTEEPPISYDPDDMNLGEISVPLGEAHDETYYLIGNPFMAHLDMEEFFSENASFDGTYWVLSDGNQQVTVGNVNGLISTGDGQIAPLQSFFVKLGKNEDGTLKEAPTEVTFTAEMQTLGGTSTDDETTSGQALLITAQTQDGRTSRAAVAYNAMASDDYHSAEDAELFLDSNLGDVPMVYTVAGTMATSINVRTACERVPLGVYGAKDEEVTLRFEGTDLFSGVKLYDAKSGNYTTLTDGREVRVRTNDYGRYYLTGGLSTDNDRIHTGDDISIYSLRPGEIVVTTVGTPLRAVRVYGIDGDLVTQQSLANQTAYRLNVPRGAIYVVYAEDMDVIIRNLKLRVR